MAVKFAGTMNAINHGLDATKPAKGADMEDWEAALADLDMPGAKGDPARSLLIAWVPRRPRSPTRPTSRRTRSVRWARR